MKRLFAFVAAAMLGLAAFAPSASAGLFFYGGETNQLTYENHEGLFDGVTGNLKGALAPPVVGDHLAGIFQVTLARDITSGSNATNGPDTLAWTGVFAQKVLAVVPAGPGFFTVTLGNPTTTTFNDAAGLDTFTLTGLLGGGRQFALYEQAVLGGTPYTFQGLLAANVADASDGTLLLTAGIDAGTPTDGAGSNVFIPVLPPFGTIAVPFAALSIVDNFTPYLFSPVTVGLLTGEMVLASRVDLIVDPNGLSKWSYVSHDPAHLRPNVIPEPATMSLLGMGLGLGFLRRRRLA